jgi:hypothetical protein
MSGAGDSVHEGGSRRERGHPCVGRFHDVGHALACAAARVNEPGSLQERGRYLGEHRSVGFCHQRVLDGLLQRHRPDPRPAPPVNCSASQRTPPDMERETLDDGAPEDSLTGREEEHAMRLRHRAGILALSRLILAGHCVQSSTDSPPSGNGQRRRHPL